MYRRMNAVSVELDELGLKHRSSAEVMLGRMAGSDDIAALRALADAVQPASISIREKEAEAAGGIQTSDIPLNRMVDAVAPESEMVRRFSGDVDQFAASKFQTRRRKLAFARNWFCGVTMALNCSPCCRIHFC